MYTNKNYKTKKAFKADLAEGKEIGTFQHGGMFAPKTEGWVTIEGPHFPQPHRWYAQAELRNGLVVKVK